MSKTKHNKKTVKTENSDLTVFSNFLKYYL